MSGIPNRIVETQIPWTILLTRTLWQMTASPCVCLYVCVLGLFVCELGCWDLNSSDNSSRQNSLANDIKSLCLAANTWHPNWLLQPRTEFKFWFINRKLLMSKDAKKCFDQTYLMCFAQPISKGQFDEKISHRNCELYFGTANKRQVAQVEIVITVYFYFSFSSFIFTHESTWYFEYPKGLGE